MYSINYTYPLTINSISLSDAGQYHCTAGIQHGGIENVKNSDMVHVDTTIYIKCK